MNDFTPKTDKEIDEEKLFPAGEYDFDCLKALVTLSKSSDARMIETQLHVYVGARTYYVTDYMTASPKMQWKLRHFCDTLGILPAYESGSLDEIAAVAVNKSGKAKFVVSPNQNPAFSDRNSVKDYVKRAAGDNLPVAAKARAEVTPGVAAQFADDDIPF